MGLLETTSSEFLLAYVANSPSSTFSNASESDSPVSALSTISNLISGDSFSTQNSSIVDNSTLPVDTCDQILLNFTEAQELNFNKQRLIRVVITWIIFVISAAGNSFVLASVTIRRPNRSHTHSQIMMTHLTVANLAFTLFFLPMDAIWQTTGQWYGGDVLCRLTNVLKQLSMYSSSAMVVVMGVDRVLNLMRPTTGILQRKRIMYVLCGAWGFSILNAIPAGVLFRAPDYHPEPRCPDHFILQCLDWSIPVSADADRVDLSFYYIYTMFISFFLPLACIIICYILIALAISKMARVSKEVQRRSLNHTSGSKRGLDRARRISLIVTALITATFIICWGPYYVTWLAEWFNAIQLSPTARDFLVMSVNLNPMLHPLITIWLIKEIRDGIMTQFKRNRNNSYLRSPSKKHSPKNHCDGNDENGVAKLLPKNKNHSSKTKEVWL